MVMRCLLVFVVFSPLLFFGQQDFGVWSKASFQYKLNKKISFASKSELRTKENALRRSQLYTQLSGKYKFNKNFSVIIAYRIKSLQKEFGDEIQNRFHTDLTKRIRFDNLSIYLRSRTQYNISHRTNNEWYERLRLKARYSFNKKVNCFIYDELYLFINNTEQIPYNKNRFGTGIEYKLKKSLTVQLKYLRIRDVNISNPETLNIIGVTLNHQLN
ncbi:MAG: hypothetical protein CL853_08595 [Crocinitomicaceae bacterium]|nr:hypothetical protein [Crocinitomicaceae bacterium]